ncbi:liver-expressed antimicrobial peptide 2 [Austrofundulus limnaeus]|uniref:Liver-expressed antimicrobial peptide 2 n=1 Tax=Austrofundulus limnaeus TaxID=52670 RepID=A0A2I4C143_AUSLI|nr:PREDICTED: liver-expressed antimicrobial peptide 2-like [Austrofundulus limnaeus]
MQQKSLFTQRKVLVVTCIAVLILAQQAHAGPLVSQVQSSSVQSADSAGEHTLRRMARMTPLWRIMSSKPSGAFCQNNFECSTGLCRNGHCSTNKQASSEPVKY